MKIESEPDELIPPALLAQVEALAAAQHRTAQDVMRDAIEHYLRKRQAAAKEGGSLPGAKLTPQEAVERILELRKGNILPDGVTIHDLQTHGRG